MKKYIIILYYALAACNAYTLEMLEKSLNPLVRILTPVPEGRKAVTNDIIIQLYGSGSTTPTPFFIGDATELISHPSFDLDRATMIYAHGYIELTSDESVRTISGAYLKNGAFNVLVVDWSNLAFGNYISAGNNVEKVGLAVGRAIMQLLNSGLSVKDIHLVGHSLGAHVIGYIARYLKSAGNTVPRLTGLDPALPGFYPALLGEPIGPDDGDFVDILHTNPGGYGVITRTGHVDFWANPGKIKQPGCLPITIPLTEEDFCSHWRSWRFWSASVAGEEFLARKCSNELAFNSGQCNDNNIAVMGINATSNLRGNYYFRTRAKKPYSKGNEGTKSALFSI